MSTGKLSLSQHTHEIFSSPIVAITYGVGTVSYPAVSASDVLRLRIAQLLREHGWTQAQLAEKMGRDGSWPSKILSGKWNPPVGLLDAIAIAFAVDVSSLFDETLLAREAAPKRGEKKLADSVKAAAADADDIPATASESLDQLGRAMVRDLENPAIQEAVATFKRLSPDQQEDAIDYMRGLRRGVSERTRGRKVGNR